jgi:EAL domain-containing protein (putative c-di-GMP-specific phosphodiesterase class I)
VLDGVGGGLFEALLPLVLADIVSGSGHGWGTLRMSVNVSPNQFRGQTLPLRVAQILSETKLDPRLLELELTENILMHDIDQVIVQLQQLSDLGVAISIDDFGTGFSSLSYVKRLPVDRLKIDQSFIRNVVSDPSDRAIVAAIVNLAHSLRMEVVAEGVETVEQLEYVRGVGCDAVQGNYCGRPMAAAQFEEFIARNRHVAATAIGRGKNVIVTATTEGFDGLCARLPRVGTTSTDKTPLISASIKVA